jgi:hypothetical protein
LGRTAQLPRESQHLNRTLQISVCHPLCTTISRLVPFPVIVKIKKRVCRGCGPVFRSPSLRIPTQTPTNPTIKPNIPMLPPTLSS